MPASQKGREHTSHVCVWGCDAFYFTCNLRLYVIISPCNCLPYLHSFVIYGKFILTRSMLHTRYLAPKHWSFRFEISERNVARHLSTVRANYCSTVTLHVTMGTQCPEDGWLPWTESSLRKMFLALASFFNCFHSFKALLRMWLVKCR
jgi:hypothetical protein